MVETARGIENAPHLLVVHQFDEEALIRHNLVVHHTERVRETKTPGGKKGNP